MFSRTDCIFFLFTSKFLEILPSEELFFLNGAFSGWYICFIFFIRPSLAPLSLFAPFGLRTGAFPRFPKVRTAPSPKSAPKLLVSLFLRMSEVSSAGSLHAAFSFIWALDARVILFAPSLKFISCFDDSANFPALSFSKTFSWGSFWRCISPFEPKLVAVPTGPSLKLLSFRKDSFSLARKVFPLI